jgi:hypothetical protein
MAEPSRQEISVHKLFAVIAATAMAAGASASPAGAEIIKSEAALAGKNFCWWSGWDSEQYGRDHTYVYSYHVQIWFPQQYVVRGTWSIGRDGTVTLKMEAGGTLVRRYDIDGDHVTELTGTLSGGSDGHDC